MADPDTVRRLTRLTADEMPDADLDGFLDDNGRSARLAAADALEAFAGSLVDVSSDDITLSGSKRAATLMSRAASLREQAAALGETPDDSSFDVVFPAGSRPELTERWSW